MNFIFPDNDEDDACKWTQLGIATFITQTSISYDINSNKCGFQSILECVNSSLTRKYKIEFFKSKSR